MKHAISLILTLALPRACARASARARRTEACRWIFRSWTRIMQSQMQSYMKRLYEVKHEKCAESDVACLPVIQPAEL